MAGVARLHPCLERVEGVGAEPCHALGHRTEQQHLVRVRVIGLGLGLRVRVMARARARPRARARVRDQG